MSCSATNARRIRRVRAILLTHDNRVLFIKRVKPHNQTPYWVAPGGGVEAVDTSLADALQRELYEELGAKAEILADAFVLRHTKAGKLLEEHFFICRLLSYDVSRRDGPEFDDPERGEYIPDLIDLSADSIAGIDLKTEELREWLLANLDYLRTL